MALSMEGHKLWLLAVEAAHELGTLNTNNKKESMRVHDCTNLEMVSGKTLVTMGIWGGKEKGSLQRSD